MNRDARHKAAFFRQSGWLMIANVAGGALMMGVHFLSKKIPEAEYGTVGKLLAATIIIPVIPLQMVFAREAAAALARGNTRALAGMIRKTLAALAGLWVLAALGILFFQGTILTEWKISQPLTLWIFLLVALGALLTPVFGGVLQGQQNFLWLGWTMMLNAVGRLVVSALLVFFIAKTAAGILAGILAGMVAALIIAMWQTRSLWTGPAERFEVAPLLRQVIPLMIGFGTCQFMFSADAIYVGRFFSGEETGYYTAAGTLSRALIWLVMPLASVMFPKLVHSAAKSEKSNLLALTLVSTAALSICGAVGLSVVGPWVVKFVFTPNYVAVATAIIPWYAGAMVPLSLANVLVNSLLAKADFRIVPWLTASAIGYGAALAAIGRHAGGLGTPGLVMILQTLAGFTTLLFLVCALFTWGPLARREAAGAAAPG